MADIFDFTNNLDIKNDKEQLPSIEAEEIDVVFNDDPDVDITDDYKYSREKLINMIQLSEAVLNHAVKDMSQNPGPRPVEAFSTLIKTINETHDRLFSIHEKMKKITTPKEIKQNEDKPKTIRATVNDIIDELSNK